MRSGARCLEPRLLLETNGLSNEVSHGSCLQDRRKIEDWWHTQVAGSGTNARAAALENRVAAQAKAWSHLTRWDGPSAPSL